VLLGQERRQVLTAVVEELADAEEELLLARQRDASPGLRRLLRGLDRTVDLPDSPATLRPPIQWLILPSSVLRSACFSKTSVISPPSGSRPD
jgi:hypothetical protein